MKKTTLEVYKEDMKFSAGHFTIFSATERENLHGHNYRVAVSIGAPVGENGMSFNYQLVKQRVRQLCQTLDEKLLLPEHSPYLRFDHQGDYFQVKFAEEILFFLPRDVLLLPIRNVTVEALSAYFIEQLTEGENHLPLEMIERLEVKVYSGPGQSGSSEWIACS